MKLRFLGVRGSRPTHKRGLLGFGGHSTSLEFIFDNIPNFYLFLDGGSGIAYKGLSMEATGIGDNCDYHFLITHTHWDHILGLPFFTPLYHAGNNFTFYSSRTSRGTFTDLFFGLHSAENIPIPPRVFKAKVKFKTLAPGDSFFIKNLVKIDTYQINHQGVTLAYRLSSGKDSVAIVTDHAPIENGNYMGENMREKAANDPNFEENFKQGLVDFLQDCHTVVYDTHFTEENLKPDWGHSTPPRALDCCIQANVKRLILFHHAPEDSDQDVYNKIESVKDRAVENGVMVVAAKEGEEWELHSV